MLVIASLLMGGRALAQGETSCLAILSHAESEFASGRFFGIPGMLEECLRSNSFTNEEKVRVYMLLTQVYLLTDDPQSADEAYLKLLGANPEFVPSDLDPIDVIYLSKKFTSTPIFTPHLKAGMNLSNQSVIRAQNVSASPDSAQLKRVPMVGWTLGGGVEWNYNDNLGIGLEGFISQRRFKTNTNNIFKQDNLSTEERQLWLDIPAYVRYGWHKGKFRPFAYAGATVNFLLMAKWDESFNDREGGGGEGDQVTPVNAPARNITYKRNFFNYSLVFGGGTKIKVGKDFVIIDVRVMPGLTNVTNRKYANYASKERTAMDPSLTRFGSMSDFFRVNSISVSVGYSMPIYNPRKARNVKTKSVSRKLIRDNKDEK